MLKKYYKYIILAIPALLLIILNYKIYVVNLIPLNYCFLFTVISIIFDAIIDICLLVKKRFINILSYLLIILITIISIIGIIYINHTEHFLDNNFGNNETTYKLTYYIASKNKYKTSELASKEIVYYDKTPNIEKALSEFNKNYKSKVVSESDLDKVITSDIFLIESATYHMLLEENKDTKYYIIYEFTLEFPLDFEDKKEPTQEVINDDGKKLVKDPDAYNIYIGGYDFSNVRMDFNVVVTINMRTHEIFFTNIPRDYYLTIPGKGKKDTLSTMSPYGVHNNIRAIENMLDINLDYYLTTKTPGFVKFVDSIGGITYCSNKAFTTNHALVLGTYDDTVGEHLKVKKGCQHLNGIETLTVARERMAFETQDIARQTNNAAIMRAILKKMKSPTIVVNYTSILDAVGGMYTTNIPKNLIQQGTKALLNDEWKINNTVLVGVTKFGTCELSGTYKYVMHPNQPSINRAKKTINNIIYIEED